MMRKRRYRKAHNVHVSRLHFRVEESRKAYSEFKKFLVWYEKHESEFKFKLHRSGKNEMTIEGVNPLIQVGYGGDFHVFVYVDDIYEEFFFASAYSRQIKHGYHNIGIMEKWRTIYFSEQALLEHEAFEPLRDWINNKLPQYNWVSLFRLGGISGAHIGVEKNLECAVRHFPVWLDNTGATQ
jgi:hypothetical protein